jgi:F0F1-type ATP synthase assembly protein I
MSDPNEPKQNSDNIWALLGRYMSLAMALPVSTFVGYAIGYGLDHWFGTTYLRIVFLLLGIVAGFVELLRGIKREKF